MPPRSVRVLAYYGCFEWGAFVTDHTCNALPTEQVQELEDLVYELSVHLDTVKDTQAYMKSIKQYHNQGT